MFNWSEITHIEKLFVGSTIWLAISLLFPWFSVMGVGMSMIQSWYGTTLFAFYLVLAGSMFEYKFYSIYVSFTLNMSILVKLGYAFYSIQSVGSLFGTPAFLPDVSGWNVLAFGVYSFAVGLLTNLVVGLQYLRASNQTESILNNRNLFVLISFWGLGLFVSLYAGISQAAIYALLSLFSFIYTRS